jgi:hypothetical protein
MMAGVTWCCGGHARFGVDRLWPAFSARASARGVPMWCAMAGAWLWRSRAWPVANPRRWLVEAVRRPSLA